MAGKHWMSLQNYDDDGNDDDDAGNDDDADDDNKSVWGRLHALCL